MQRVLRPFAALPAIAILSSCGGSGGGGKPPPPPPQAFAVGGTASGILGSGLVLENNGGDDLTIATNGPFAFATTVESGLPYEVTLKTPPSNPSQACSVVNGSGTITSVAVTSVTLVCGGPLLSLITGQLGGPGNMDGSGTSARFDRPVGAGIDAAGNVYVADWGNNTIRKITPAGVVTTFAGNGQSGSTDGAGRAAMFFEPRAVAVDVSGNLYVADTENNTIRKITSTGVVTTLAGLAGSTGSADGAGSAARFNWPAGIDVDLSGTLYVADTNNHTIRRITPGGAVTTLAGVAGKAGSADGAAGTATFNFPQGVAVDAAGNVYVADSWNSTVRKIAAGMVTTLAGMAGVTGSVDGTGVTARFTGPTGIAADASGAIIVADTGNNTLRRVTVGGAVTTLAGMAGSTGAVDGAGSAARFDEPKGVRVDASGAIFLVDTENNTVRRVTPTGQVTTLAGAASPPGSPDRQTANYLSHFPAPFGLAADVAGNTYFADASTIRKVTLGGVVTTLAGSPGGGTGFADGTGSAALFAFPAGPAVDSNGTIYVADRQNNSIRVVTESGVVTTLAGNGSFFGGSADGTGAAAQFNGPVSVAIDASGNLYVADYYNETIRKITTPTGVVTTFAGTAGVLGSRDGTGAAASFYDPSAVATDGGGNVYVADSGNCTIRKITPAAVVSTLAGTAFNCGLVDGTGAAARFLDPSGLAVDAAGNIYVADFNIVRKITPAGVVTTVAGVPGSIGVALGVLPASLNGLSGIAAFPGATVSLVLMSENSILRADLP